MRIAIKIDVDTYRGLAEGLPRLAHFLRSQRIPASFFVTLGPDTSGLAVFRVFTRAGFLQKMQRTSALSVYGWRTALSGTLLPPRPMALSFVQRLRHYQHEDFEISPHGYDHIRWHNHASQWSAEQAEAELERVWDIYHGAFGKAPNSFAAPGWQAGPGVWLAMEPCKLLYHSDTRGEYPFFPLVQGQRLQTLEIPTTLPTWDEMLAWDGVTDENLVEKTYALLRTDRVNVWTIHAEFEGQTYFHRFKELIEHVMASDVEWIFLPFWAHELKDRAAQVPICSISQGTLPGRAGTVTMQVVKEGASFSHG